MSGGAAAAVSVSLAGCSLTGRAGAADEDADVALVEAALTEEIAFGAMCEKLRRQHRTLARRLDAVAAIQTAHADALSNTLADPPPTPMPTIGGTETAVSIRDVSREANRLYAKRLADCMAAEAGALAQMFGSMAASHAVTAQYWRST